MRHQEGVLVVAVRIPAAYSRPPQAARTAQRHSGGHHTCLLALVSRLGPPELPWAEVPWAEVPWAEVPWLEVAHVRPKCASRRAAEGSGVARV